MTKFKLPIQSFTVDKDNVINGSFHKVKIKVMHEGENYNDSTFSFKAIEKAKDTISNIPILANVLEDEGDFGGHDYEQKVFKNDGKYVVETTYLEQPIGVIPESNNYHYEVIDGVKWVVVEGYIWKMYSNRAYNFLSDTKEKGISMEIYVDDSEEKNGVHHINNYTYTGITVLGDKLAPAMGEEAKLTMFSKNEEYCKKVDELNNLLKFSLESSEVENLEDNKNQEVAETVETTEVEVKETETEKVEEVEATEEKEYSTEENTEEQEEKSEEQEETKETETKEEEVEATEEKSEEEATEETEVKEEEVEESSEEETEESSEETSEEVKEEAKEEFSKTEDKSHSMSTSQLFQEIEKELDKVTEMFDFWWAEEPVEAPSFWRLDVLFDKQVVVAYEEATGTIYGLPYLIKGDEVKIDFTMKKPYICEWREKVIEEETLNFSKLRKENEGIKLAFEKLKQEKQALVKYKVEAEVEEVVKKFSLSEEEINSEKAKVLNGECSIETFTDKLCILEGRKKLENKATYSKKEKAKSIPIADDVIESKLSKCPYPSLASSLV